MSNDPQKSLGQLPSLIGRVDKSDSDTDDKSLSDAVTQVRGISQVDLPDSLQDLVELTDRYQLERTLGRGGMGQVDLATDRRLGRKVAIKRIHEKTAASPAAIERFLTEAKAIAALNHPHIVQIHDFGWTKDGPFFVMEYVDGGNLLELSERGAISVERAVDIVCQLCDGLKKADEAGIVHRDLKPANILMTKDGIPKLTDFGLAKAESADTGMTMTGMVLGTLDFMPPEQRKDAALVDARSDLWSLAATLYQVVTGESPRVIDLDLCPQQLRSVLANGLKTKKEDRYQSASDFKEALRHSLRDDSPDGMVVEQGQCLKCGTKNDSSRRFCRNPKCGASLEVSCLSCSTKIPVWEAICGSCGGKQQELATTIKQQKDSQRVKAEEALEANNFSLAHSLASTLVEEQDPRLQQLVSWAKQFQLDIDAAQNKYLEQISHWLSESLQHEKAFDYASGVRALQQVSESAREVMVPGYDETVSQVLLRLNRKHADVGALERKIRDSVEHRNFAGLLPEIERLLALVPDRVDMLRLKDELVARQIKLQQVRDESYTEAENAFAKQDYVGCLTALNKIDSTLEDAAILALKKKASAINEEINRLDQQITQAMERKQYDGLLEIVGQYLALQSQDLKRQQLREQLIARDGKRNAQVAEIIKRAGDFRSKAEFSSAIAELRRIPESLMTEEVVFLEGKCSELKEQQQVAVSELRRSLDQSDFDSELNGVRGYLSILRQLNDVRDIKFEQLQLEFQKKQDEYRHRLEQERKRKENLTIATIAGFVTTGVILIVGTAFMYSSYRRSGLISAALQREDYAMVLAIDAGNTEALQLKEKAEKKSAAIQAALAKGDYKAVLRLEPNNSQALAMKMNAEMICNSIGMDLNLLSPGSFTMGEGVDSHTVALTRSFYIGVYEVTQEQYERVMGQNPSNFKGLKNPVENVSWEDAVEFCRKLSALPEEMAAGRVYRLPTEAEWEYACRAGTTTGYSFGDDESQLEQYAWFWYDSETHPVGQKKPNVWGLYDMHGNVWEWCSDWYDDYPAGVVTDPVGPSTGSLRVNRGGSWLVEAAVCRSARRGRLDPSSRSSNYGFRVALSPSGISE